MKIIELKKEDVSCAADIQQAIDTLRDDGGIIQLPEMSLTLDRGLELYSDICLYGAGDKTILRKGPSRIYPLSGYHNYAMADVPLLDTNGLEVGMTVSIKDNLRGGFMTTFARISWIDDNWVGLDRGIAMDYSADENPVLTTAYSMLFAHDSENISIKDITLDGNLAENESSMDGCRGGAIYFASCKNVTVDNVHEADYNGEGLSFQLCQSVRILDSSFSKNSGNGLHPGAGSTDVLFENCEGYKNGASGFFFCVRANHITIRDCSFEDNDGPGISIGTRDCHNLIENCTILNNGGPGIHARFAPVPTEVHSCLTRSCQFRGNGHKTDGVQILCESDAHSLIFETCAIAGDIGIACRENAKDICTIDIEFDCTQDTEGEGFVEQRPEFESGHDACLEIHKRHLSL
ncbi:MAG: right-handed parallel beta-helix repeat-containing protein [Lentisphaeria bacterium]|nr:right-handed parallel beta-helix repeat-containing protein [Lentisphaeria bacterium]NQZ69963.1 right-handed parallel beta-helix repeat-containing protein [Lentisphaeria bacterium]